MLCPCNGRLTNAKILIYKLFKAMIIRISTGMSVALDKLIPKLALKYRDENSRDGPAEGSKVPPCMSSLLTKPW